MDEQLIELHIFNNYTHLVSRNYLGLEQLKDLLKVKVEGAQYSEKFKRKLWDGCVQFLKEGKILTGLLPLTIHYIQSLSIPYILYDMRKEIITNINPINLKGITLRDYQVQGIIAAIQYKRGIISAATNAGKSLLAAGLMQALNVKTLFLTHRVELFNQTKNELEDKLGVKLGYISTEGIDLTKQITIAMVPTLQLKCGSEKKVKENGKTKKVITFPDLEILTFLNSIDLLIIDEAHHSSADTYEKIILKTNTLYRIGLSGTPQLEETVAGRKLMGLIGGSIFDISNKDLVDMGVSSIPEINMIMIKDTINEKEYNKVYELGIVKNEKRNKVILDKCREFLQKKLNTLIIINNIEHGEHLLQYLVSCGVKEEDIKFISGSSKHKEDRTNYLKQFSEGKLPILIASLIVQEGISMKSIGALIFALGGKSNIRVMQCLGRGLRQNQHGNKVEVVDFIDTCDRRLYKHSKARLEYYQKDLSEYVKIIK